MLSSGLRIILSVLAATYGALGAILFVVPDWASNNFAWRISPFVAMTIGGWSLGTAWACLIVARRAHWPAAICTILYLACFGCFETAVLIAFRERLLIGNLLTWLYCAALFGTCAFALLALIEARRRRPVLMAVGPPLGVTATLLAELCIGLVGFLGVYGLTAVQGMRGLNASIFPEVISPFSLRAFGAFYFALALAAVPLLFARGIGNLVNHGTAMCGLVVLITVAALVYIDRFDFAGHPKQIIYIGIYVAVALAVGTYLARYGTGASFIRKC